jgi:hypothetical protein
LATLVEDQVRDILKPMSVAIGVAAVLAALVIAANTWPRRSTVAVPAADSTPVPGVSLTFSAVAIAAGSENRDDDWTYEALPIGADGVRTERWNADFERRRVTITVEAQPDTTAEQLADAHLIIKSIRSEPTETGAFRLTFTLPGGWDSG